MTRRDELGTRKPPGEWTPEAEALILDALRDLLPIHVCAALGGLGKTALNDRRASDPDWDALCDLMRAEGQRRDLSGIRRASEANPALWAGRAWILERTHPEEYGRRDKVAVDVTLAGLVAASFEDLAALPVGQGARGAISGRFERTRDDDTGDPLKMLPEGSRASD